MEAVVNSKNTIDSEFGRLPSVDSIRNCCIFGFNLSSQLVDNEITCHN